jgi:hypothetical protein
LTVFLLWLGAWLAPQPSAEFPHPDEFAKRVRERLRLDNEIQERFSYIERRRDVKVSKLGKVSIGPLRTFEVYPSDRPGGTYKRLIEIDGRPLSPAELARRDAEHQRDLRREAERAAKETPQQRAARMEKQEDELRQRDAIFNDAVAVYAPTFAGYETVEGRRVLVADVAPRPQARVATREGRWMKQFAGRIWVDATDYQIVRLEMQAFDDISVGWGIVGRLNRGSRLRIVRTRFQDAWVPAETTYAAKGRTLLFRPFEFEVTATYSNYQRR